jgi:PAS domain S-box-containing protein
MQEESQTGENKLLRSRITELENQLASYDFSLNGYPKVVENAPFAFTRVLENTNGFALVNKEFTRQSGYTLEEFNSLPFDKQVNIIHDKDRKPLMDAYKKWAEGGFHHTFHHTYRIINKHGKLLWLDAYYYAERDKQGRLYAIDHIYIDVTDRKNSERELTESNEKYKTLAESIPAAVIIFSGPKMVYCNEYALTLTGYTREVMKDMDFWDIVHPEMRELVKERGFKRQRGEYVPPRYELKILTKAGKTLWLDFTGALINYEDKPSILGIAYDITELKLAQSALSESEEKYKILIENMGDALVYSDNDEKILFVNENLCRLAGFEKHELIGKNASELLAVGDYQKTVKDKAALRKTGISDTYEVKMLNKEGDELWIEISGAPHRDSSGNVIGSIGIHRDITDRKKYEKTIEENLKQKEMLLREIHHRVKNNLQIISSLLNLQAGYINEDKYGVMFHESQNRIKAMTLIHEVLYRSGDLSVINIYEYISNLIRHLFNSYRANINKIRYEIIASGVYLDIDTAIPIGLIINELVSNSLKYAFPDGREGLISVTIEDMAGNLCLLQCKDTGIGYSGNNDNAGLKTLGLRLVKILADQMSAKSDLITDNGVCYSFIFKKQNYERRV